jgi:hypothetical protein
MREFCFCGWEGEIADREPVPLPDGAWALACPRCGHLDDMMWLRRSAREALLRQAMERVSARTDESRAERAA